LAGASVGIGSEALIKYLQMLGMQLVDDAVCKFIELHSADEDNVHQGILLFWSSMRLILKRNVRISTIYGFSADCVVSHG
jgi:hypothetical protein